MWDGYHTKHAVVREGASIVIEDPTLLLYVLAVWKPPRWLFDRMLRFVKPSAEEQNATALMKGRYDIDRAAILRQPVWDGTTDLFEGFVHIGNTEGAIDIAVDEKNPESVKKVPGSRSHSSPGSPGSPR